MYFFGRIYSHNVIKFITLCILHLFSTYTTVNGVTYKLPLVYSNGNSSVLVVSRNSVLPLAVMRGQSGQGYYITISVGTPSQEINVLVDTGSSNFAIAAAPNPYIIRYFNPNDSNTYKQVESNMSTPYTQGRWEGPLGIDKVAFYNAMDISIAAYVATIIKSDNFFINGSNWQGILGLAYATIARPNSSIMPLFDQLVSEKHVSNVFSLQFCGQNDISNSGALVLGGVDPKLYRGEITYAPLHREWYYEIILTDIKVGDISIPVECKELNTDKTIVDSGTTSLRLPRKVFDAAVEILKRQVRLEDPIPDEFWTGNTVMCWLVESSSLKLFPKLRISIAHSRNSSFTLLIPPQQYLRFVGDIRSLVLNRTLNCYRFAINPSDSGTVLGTIILEGFYIIFDRQNKRVGFSKASCGLDPKFDIQSQIIGPFENADPTKCAYDIRKYENESLMIVAYVITGVFGFCLIPLLILIFRKIYSRVVGTKNEEQHLTESHRQSDMASLMGNE